MNSNLEHPTLPPEKWTRIISGSIVLPRVHNRDRPSHCEQRTDSPW